MNQSRIYAKSVGHMICLVTMSLIVIAATATVAIAQSTDISNPTHLTSNEISGSFDRSSLGDSYFYSFTAGPGELVITYSLKGGGAYSTAQYSVAVLDENSKELSSSFLTAGGTKSEQQVMRVDVSKKQVVLLRIRVSAIMYGTANYRLRLSGAVHIGQQVETDETDPVMAGALRAIRSRESKVDNLGCLPKQGTLIVKMKDGSKKIIDLSEAETVTIVP
jgi:hypothetical protein